MSCQLRGGRDIRLGPSEPRGRPGQDWLRGEGSIYILGLCFPGCFSIRGPASVRGREQGSLTVQCRYDPKWETYVKWWCKGARWSPCQILVKTTASEWEKDRVSIKDNQTSHIFTVTMKELRRDDADTYWCGIERSGIDLTVQVVVTIDQGKRMWTCLFMICSVLVSRVPL